MALSSIHPESILVDSFKETKSWTLTTSETLHVVCVLVITALCALIIDSTVISFCMLAVIIGLGLSWLMEEQEEIEFVIKLVPVTNSSSEENGSDNRYVFVPALYKNNDGHLTMESIAASKAKRVQRWLYRGAPVELSMDHALALELKIPKVLNYAPSQQIMNQRLDQVSGCIDRNMHDKLEDERWFAESGQIVVQETALVVGLQLREHRRKIEGIQDFLRNH
jgi:hypothetical protein